MGYPNYVWIIPDWYTEQQWVENSSLQERFDSDVFLHGTILISHHPINTEQSAVTVSGEVSRFNYIDFVLK